MNEINVVPVENEKNVFKNDKGFRDESEREENKPDDILKRLTLIKKLRRQSVSPITRNIRKGKFDAMTFPSNFSFSNVTRIKALRSIRNYRDTWNRYRH